MKPSDRIAIWGGAFDPPHLGHREVIEDLLSLARFKKVLVLPTGRSAQKPLLTPGRERLRICELAFQGLIGVEVSDFEIQKAEHSFAPTPTFETLEALPAALGQPVTWVIGADQLESISSWYRFPEVLGLTDWVVVGRHPYGVEGALKHLQKLEAQGLVKKERDADLGPLYRLPRDKQLLLMPTSARGISSSEIRAEIARTGRPPQGSLAPEVLDYLLAHGLYGTR